MAKYFLIDDFIKCADVAEKSSHTAHRDIEASLLFGFVSTLQADVPAALAASSLGCLPV